MAFRYVSAEEAMQAEGLRMVVVGQVPSPWGEAAKGIFHLKKLDWLAVRTDYENDALKAWAGGTGGPFVVWQKERPRDRWIDILLLAERLAPAPALLPADPEQRAIAIGLAHEIIGEDGLAWSRRLQMVHAGLAGQGGFVPPVAKYLARKYGHTPQAGEGATARIVQLLRMLSGRLKKQQAAGSRYYLGDSLTAVDIYSATALALFRPLAPEVCDMKADTRAAFGFSHPAVEVALDPVLFAHREMMYREHLGLPLSL
jgi:glutathione S-transferase